MKNYEGTIRCEMLYRHGCDLFLLYLALIFVVGPFLPPIAAFWYFLPLLAVCLSREVPMNLDISESLLSLQLWKWNLKGVLRSRVQQVTFFCSKTGCLAVMELSGNLSVMRNRSVIGFFFYCIRNKKNLLVINIPIESKDMAFSTLKTAFGKKVKYRSSLFCAFHQKQCERNT